MGTILIVDDSVQFKDQLGAEYSTEMAGDLASVRAAMAAHSYDAVLLGETLGEEKQREVFGAVREADSTVTVVFAGHDAILAAAKEMKEAGACDVLMHPFSPERVRCVAQRAARQTALVRENRTLKARVEQMQTTDTDKAHALAEPHNGHRAELSWIESLPPRLDLRELLAAVEKSVIERTLAATEGAQAEAARRLGLSRSDLSYKLSKYELRKPR